MSQCWLSLSYKHRRGTELSPGTHSHPTPADSALDERSCRERASSCFASPAQSSWMGFLPGFAVSGVFFCLFGFFALFLVCFQSVKSWRLFLAPGDNLAEIPAGMLALIAAGQANSASVPRACSPSWNADGRQWMQPSLCSCPSAGFHPSEPLWKPGIFLLWLSENL